MPKPPDFELRIGTGFHFRHFTRAWVTRRLDTAADEFQLDYADLRPDLRRPGSPRSTPLFAGPPPIEVGQPCIISVRGLKLLTGYIDDVSYGYEADNLTLTARGRAKTGDLVDCSAVRKGGRWAEATLERICTDICTPFGIKVRAEIPADVLSKPFKRFVIEPGEMAIDTIQRACRIRGVWATNDVDGNLVLTRASKTERRAKQAIEYGTNVIRGERYDSWTQRHDQYLLKAQVAGDDEMNKRGAAQLSEVIIDDAIDRYRPLLLVTAGGQNSRDDLKQRALWERNRRAGTGERWIYRVDGYGFSENKKLRLWEPNMMVHVLDPRLSTDEWLLIASVVYRWQAEGEDGGRVTDLTLTRPEAFDVEPYPKPKPKKGRGSGARTDAAFNKLVEEEL